MTADQSDSSRSPRQPIPGSKWGLKAVRIDLFEETLIPAIKNGKVKRFNQFHLSDEMEQKDPTCKPILDYSRSLLYLVSQSLEQGRTTPILGMEKYFNDKIASKKLVNVQELRRGQACVLTY